MILSRTGKDTDRSVYNADPRTFKGFALVPGMSKAHFDGLRPRLSMESRRYILV